MANGLHVLLDIHETSLLGGRIDYSHRLSACVNGTTAKECTLRPIVICLRRS
ncbi:hypothetical protein ACCUM_2051 [Candidatus Accumulibacter phosphatis]|uniref:Uncharacterized protein n=1 Tax=Candidatus Accumulibacter phosphatis TaxID=327160 RepID=A0A5S4EIB3_9PROT|nr:hypothetical protein ACCUM_2051 [Candidatus Accumulibacter phosphatis]